MRLYKPVAAVVVGVNATLGVDDVVEKPSGPDQLYDTMPPVPDATPELSVKGRPTHILLGVAVNPPKEG